MWFISGPILTLVPKSSSGGGPVISVTDDAQFPLVSQRYLAVILTENPAGRGGRGLI